MKVYSLLCAALAALGTLVAGCAREDSDVAVVQERQRTTRQVTIQELRTPGASLVGQTISTTGYIVHVSGPRTYVISEHANAMLDDGIVVVLDRPLVDAQGNEMTEALIIGDQLNVVGTVINYSDLEPTAAADDIGESFVNLPVVRVTSAQFVEVPGEPSSFTPSGYERVTDLSTVIAPADVEALVNKPVVLMNVDVRTLAGERAIWVGPAAGNNLLVVWDAGDVAPPTLVAGDRVNVYGRLLKMDAPRVKASYGLSLEAQNAVDEAVVYFDIDRIEKAE